MPDIVIYLLMFALIAIAAKQVGKVFSDVGLPYITGYLLVGMIAGPFILNAMPSESVTELRFIDELSLGIIAFIAGSELYLKEIRSRFKAIGTIIGSVVLIALPLGGISLFVLTEFIPFTQGMPFTDRLAVAVLGGTILLALSPPSTIAVIKELRAKGPFTRTLLGVTVTMDVIIVVLFAVAVAIASALINNVGFNATFLGLLVLDLGAAVVTGYLIGKILQGVLSTPFHALIKTAVILALGYGVFAASHWLTELTYGTLFEIHIEPLLVAMIGGFYVTNYTTFRNQFEGLLHDVSPFVYVAFFTLTGVGIKLDILAQTWPIALALFAVRFIAINIGGFVGMRAAGEPQRFTRFMGLALITQAGIALGLSREVAVEFPALGDAFATMVISVIVLNEIFGPMFLKSALKRVGEAQIPSSHAPASDVRDVLIFGIEAQSMELARQLQSANWRVIMADTDRTHLSQVAEEDGFIVHHIPAITDEQLADLLTDDTDAVLAMLEDDTENLKACELAYQHGVPRLIVRPTGIVDIEQFQELGALMVDPTSAMVYLLEQTVKAPQTAAILLHQDSGREMVQVTINNPDVDGVLVRDLRIPPDVIFMDVTRDGNVILPNGYTKLKLKDEVTIVGRKPSLEEATFKLGF